MQSAPHDETSRWRQHLDAFTRGRAGAATSATASTTPTATCTTTCPWERAGDGSQPQVGPVAFRPGASPLLAGRLGEIELERGTTARIDQIKAIETTAAGSVGERTVPIDEIWVKRRAGVGKRRRREVLQVRRGLRWTGRVRRSSADKRRCMLERTRLQRRKAESEKGSTARSTRRQASES